MKVNNPGRLKSRRKTRHFTQQQLAGLVKCTQQYISALERGDDHDCSERIAIAICRFLDVEVEDYFTPTPIIRVHPVATSKRASSKVAA